MLPELWHIAWKSIAGARSLLIGIIVFHTGLEEDDIMAKMFGIKPNQVHKFEPKGQEDTAEDKRTKFLVEFLDVALSANISDQVYTAKGFGAKREELLRAGTQELHILRRSLKGWENFVYEDETEVEWDDPGKGSKDKVNAVMDRNLNKIPPEWRGEIADFVRGQSSPDLD